MRDTDRHKPRDNVSGACVVLLLVSETAHARNSRKRVALSSGRHQRLRHHGHSDDRSNREGAVAGGTACGCEKARSMNGRALIVPALRLWMDCHDGAQDVGCSQPISVLHQHLHLPDSGMVEG